MHTDEMGQAGESDRPNQPDFGELRKTMVREQLEARGIRDRRVLDAMREVPRHAFVPEDLRSSAYDDGPLPIGDDQTISQPFIVGYMLQSLRLHNSDSVLEIGTGSGYQTALLSRLCARVISIERHAALAERAANLLYAQHANNVHIYVGDGSQGMADAAPFDAIIVGAVAPEVPSPLLAQLRDGGRLVLPLAESGESHRQFLVRLHRRGDSFPLTRLLPVMFVPLIGLHGFAPSADAPDQPGYSDLPDDPEANGI